MKARQLSHRISLIILTALIMLLCGCSELDFLGGGSSAAESEASVIISPYKGESDASYAYNSLTDKAVQNLYLKICEAAEDDGKIECTGSLTEKQMAQAIVAYKNDYPESFWIEDSYSYYEQNGYTYIELSFSAKGNELSEMKESFNSVIESFEADAPYDSSEYDRVVYINDFICNICEYDTEAAASSKTLGNESDAYGCLVDGKAVCSGYSRAFQLLCEKLGIDCVNVVGIGESESHQWNCVKIDGDWYNTDVTWNDSEAAGLANDYLNLSDEQFYQNHTSDPLFSDITEAEFNSRSTTNGFSYNTFIPECTETTYNYYRMTSPTLYELEGISDEIVSALAETAESGGDTFSIVIDDSLDYESAADKLINKGYILKYVDKANSELTEEYSVSSQTAYSKEQIRVVTIVLEYI